MATIELYASKVNRMPAMIREVKSSVSSLKSEILGLRTKALGVSKSVCNLDEVIDTVTAATRVQEAKVDALENFASNSEAFIEDTRRIDHKVSELVDQRKDDFYEKYYYLKPECEKTRWEKICDGCAKVAQWCKENWKAIVKIVVAVVIIVALGVASVLTGGALAVILAGAFWGALIGGVLGGILGGITSAIGGGSFLDGFADGLLSGTITGAVTGAATAGLGIAGQAFGKGIECASKLGKVIQVTARVTQVLSLGLDGFDMLAMGIGLFNPDSALVKLNQKLNSSVLYNIVKYGISGLAIFTGAASTTMQCFVAGTKILTVSGYVAIETVKAGDQVISANPDTMEKAEKTVLETYVHETAKLVHLTVNGELITATADHPFFVRDVGFVSAGDLFPGDVLLDAQGHALILERVDIEELSQPVNVYNFQVEDFHTYYVGEMNIFVHNANCAPRRPKSGVLKEVEHEDGSITYTKVINGEEISITYSKDGYPDFSGYTHPQYSDPVEITVTGDNHLDFKAANEAIGQTGSRPPKGYTWHHLEDGKHMILVRRDVHDATIGGFPHTGGASAARNS